MENLKENFAQKSYAIHSYIDWNQKNLMFYFYLFYTNLIHKIKSATSSKKSWTTKKIEKLTTLTIQR